MADLRETLRSMLSDAAGAAQKAKEKARELAGDAADKAPDVADVVREKTSDLLEAGATGLTDAAKTAGTYLAEKGGSTADLAKTGAGQAKESWDAIQTRLKDEEHLELEALGDQQTLADLSEDQQDEYLESLLAALVPFDPSQLDQLQRLYQILVVMELGKKRRHSYLKDVFLSTSPPAVAKTVSLDEATRLSLGKDIMGLASQASRQEAAADSMLAYLNSLRLSPEQIDLLNEWTSWENGMLKKIGRGDLVVGEEDVPLEAMKKAGAIGIPLGALYASGSIVGFSAAGITSGLASLGGSSGLVALGLNPMTAGIAALVLLGIGVKKVLDAGLPTSEGERQQKLEGAMRAMRARRNRHIAVLSQDLVGLQRVRRTAQGQIEGERLADATEALASLLEVEARAALDASSD